MASPFSVLVQLREQVAADPRKLAALERCLHFYFRVQASNDNEPAAGLIAEMKAFTLWLRWHLR